MKAPIKTRIAKGGEGIASAFLFANGYSILEKNWRSGRFGEIDIIAQSPEGLIVFVEVKTRREKGVSAGIPDGGFEAVNWYKRRKIAATAASYLAKQGIADQPARFDAVVISITSSDAPGQAANSLNLTHIEQAFVG